MGEKRTTIWRWTKRIFKWVGSPVIVLVAIGLGINCYDPPISPASLAYLARPPNEVPDSDNLYLAFAGFDAPDGQSLTAFGRIRQDFDDRIALDMSVGKFDEEASKKSPSGIPHRVVSGCRNPVTLWADASNVLSGDHPSGADRLLDQRYLDLLQFSRYADVRVDTFASMTAYPPSAARCIFLARVIAGLRSTNLPLRQLSAHQLLLDIRMLRIMLNNSDDFLGKRIASRALTLDWSYLAEALASQPQLIGALQQENADLVPWTTTPDWDVTRCYARMARETQDFLLGTAEGTKREGPFWNRLSLHIFPLNATINLFAEAYSREASAAAGDPRGMEARFDEQQRWISEHGLGWNIRSIYNPLGHQMLNSTWFNLETLSVLQDYRAYEKLLHLSYAIHDQNISAARVKDFMQQHPEWSVHPMSGKSFVFDPSSSSISFEPVSHEERPPLSTLKLWEAPSGAS